MRIINSQDFAVFAKCIFNKINKKEISGEKKYIYGF